MPDYHIPKEKTVHWADKINTAGAVSALCYTKPHPIDLRRATWTIVAEAVTCRKCRAKMEDMRAKRWTWRGS